MNTIAARPKSLNANIFFGGLTTLSFAAVQLAFMPICAWLLGAEAFGLVVFGVTLLLSVIFLNQSISPVLIRELGRATSAPESVARVGNLLPTLEVASLASGLLLGVAVALAAPSIAERWLIARTLTSDDLTKGIMLIGLSITCQWPSFLYRAGFIGIRRQDVFAFISIPFAAIQAIGAVVVLLTIAPSVMLLFAWQAGTFLVYSVTARMLLWRLLPKAVATAPVRLTNLLPVWRFAAGALLIGLTASLLTQTDKLVVSIYAPLDLFAAYSLGSILAVQLTLVVVSPFSAALLPHFSRIIAGGDQAAIAHEYRRWTQIVLTLVLPGLGVLLAFGEPIAKLWLGSRSPLVRPMQEFLPWLSLGTMFNVMFVVPALMQLAAGATVLMVSANFIAFGILFPVLVVLTPTHGPIIAAMSWLALNVGYFAILAPIMHARLLKTGLWQWWSTDALLPTLAVVLIFMSSASLLPTEYNLLTGVAQAVATAALAWTALIILLPLARREIVSQLRRLKQAVG